MKDREIHHIIIIIIIIIIILIGYKIYINLFAKWEPFVWELTIENQ